MKVPLSPLGLAFLVSIHLTSALSTASAQGDDGAPQPIVSRALGAAVDYGNDAIFQPSKHGIDFTQLGLRPQQTVTITVQFAAELAGQGMIAEALDGGALSLPEGGLVVATDGTVVFQFQAENSQGACRIAVHQPDDQNALNFWVIDPAHPENTPSDLPGAY